MGKGSQKHRNRGTKRTPNGAPSRAKDNRHDYAKRGCDNVSKADKAEGVEKPKFVKADPGSFGVQRQELFCLFLGQQALGYEMTCAGRLRIVGAFDGMEVEPNAILAALQRYTLLYWGEYGDTEMKMSDPSLVGRSSRFHGRSAEIPSDPTGERFRAMDECLTDAGRVARKAVHQVTVDRHFFPDENAPWADRIINTRILQKRQQFMAAGQAVPPQLRVAGQLADDDDWETLKAMKAGALALAQGRRPKREAA